MKKFGLVGFPLSHSFSKKYFNEKFINEETGNLYSYENYEMENLSGLHQLIASEPDLCGLNITIPFKQKILGLLTKVHEPALEIGAVNTIKIIRNKNTILLEGFNTDITGFESAITPFLINQHSGAMILGTGGASKAVAYVLQKLNIPYVFISRQKSATQLTYKEITEELVEKYTMIINTTPAGTFPLTSDAPSFPYSFLSPDNFLFDLVYNPEETLFMRKGLEHGAEVANGHTMLKIQAEEAWKIWTS